VEELAAAQVIVIRLGIVGLLAGYGLFFLGRELDAQSLADAASDFVLDFEDVFQLAIVAFRPDRVTRLSADELGGDAQAIACATQAAAEDARGVEFAADLGSGYGLVAIGQDGGTGEDRSSLILESSVMMSSVMPSRKYSSSLLLLRFSK
jgi:hypothetical protein